MRASLTVLLVALLLQGCLFVPSISRDSSYPRCELFTRQLDLDVVNGSGAFFDIFDRHRGCANEACLAVLAGLAAIPVGSFLVSGSIVVVGNTVHFLEAQGRCESSFVGQLFSGS